MSDKATLLSTAFDVQRTSLEQAQEGLQEGIDLQKRSAIALGGNLDAQRSAQTGAVKATRRALQTYFDTIEASFPANPILKEIRLATDDSFETAEGYHTEQWNAFERQIEENVKTFDAFAETYKSFVDDSFDQFLQAHEQIQTQIERAEGFTTEPADIDVE